MCDMGKMAVHLNYRNSTGSSFVLDYFLAIDMASCIRGIGDDFVFDDRRSFIFDGDMTCQYTCRGFAKKIGGLPDVYSISESTEDTGLHVHRGLFFHFCGIIEFDDTGRSFNELELSGKSCSFA